MRWQCSECEHEEDAPPQDAASGGGYVVILPDCPQCGEPMEPYSKEMRYGDDSARQA